MKKFENIVAKGEIACFEQFLLLAKCFRKSSVYMWRGLKINKDFMNICHNFLVSNTSVPFPYIYNKSEADVFEKHL